MTENPQSKLWLALLKVQEKLGNLARSAENPFFKSQYVPLDVLLDAVRPVLTEQGIVLIQSVQNAGMPALATRLVFAETGEAHEDCYPIRCQDPNNPQQFGAAVTYARRYGLKALLGIAEEDDDGNAASKSAQPATRAATSPTSPATPSLAQGTTSETRPAAQGKGAAKNYPPPKPQEDDGEAVMELAKQLDQHAADQGQKFRIVKDGKIGLYGKVADNIGIEKGLYSVTQLAARGVLPRVREFYAYLAKKNDLPGYDNGLPFKEESSVDLSQTF